MATGIIKKDMGNVYSTQEIIVGTWSDGKPIYRKVLGILAFGGTVNAWADTGATLNNVAQLIRVTATAGSLIPPLGYRINSNKLQYYSITTSWGNTYNVIVEYTKTTD